MSTNTVSGIEQHGQIVLNPPAVPFPDGTCVLVTPIDAPTDSGGKLLAAMFAEPRVSEEDVDALEAAIAAGERPPVS